MKGHLTNRWRQDVEDQKSKASAVASREATLYCLKGHEQRGGGTLTHCIAHSVTRGKFAGWFLISISGEGDLTRCPGSIDLQRTSPPMKL